MNYSNISHIKLSYSLQYYIILNNDFHNSKFYFIMIYVFFRYTNDNYNMKSIIIICLNHYFKIEMKKTKNKTYIQINNLIS